MQPSTATNEAGYLATSTTEGKAASIRDVTSKGLMTATHKSNVMC